jgi:hypothetical protein
MSNDRKTKAVFYNLETVRADVERTIDNSESREHWRSLVRGVLMHWLGELFDDGLGYVKDLESALDISRKQVLELKRQNERLRAQVEALRDHESGPEQR